MFALKKEKNLSNNVRKKPVLLLFAKKNWTDIFIFHFVKYFVHMNNEEEISKKKNLLSNSSIHVRGEDLNIKYRRFQCVIF